MEITQWQTNDVLEHLQSNKNLQIIDVRQPEEFQSSHIPGAKLIPLGELNERYQEIEPNVEAVIVCRSGGRSSKACELLASHGYEKIYNLAGGMLGWQGDVESNI
ncbi:rhodanese-like domain-containing protein [Alicyclobacillus tolerans]|uniref:Rhodanese-related sulfurtransferase n=1 Tax=Alicyclobacillus tolerans TaxID=90970 RepID=A0ABT9LV89_9BACL|nr:rhodanese-like domain-containing protein [Alicyclobacillus tengchongensis]MDP9728178.1 rhodanese-related sulfurtransferase [Alicyclobacillus tengchongensis]